MPGHYNTGEDYLDHEKKKKKKPKLTNLGKVLHTKKKKKKTIQSILDGIN